MTVRYRIRHTSRYQYDRSVTTSFNEARLTPLHTPWQFPLESTIAIDPMTWSYRYTDYWGTEVRAFESNGSHRTLEVEATSLVELDVQRRPPVGELGWDELRTDAVRDRFAEYLCHRPATEVPSDLGVLAADLAAEATPATAAVEIAAAVHAAMTYTPGVTEVHTTGAEAWEARRGVCQDYAHLVVGALRHVGVPARYVSGYLYPSGSPAVGDIAVGESHAWVEYWLGAWTPHDPTNLHPVADRHVMIGAGRDYSDVPPIKGIVAGTHESAELSVTVEFARLA
jgi:transglutaminase-like putative cysteine protease